MKIAEVAQASGLSVHTIRYYERRGMLPLVPRGAEGHRRFSPELLDWLVLLASLRETGMPMKTMLHFARLYRKGAATVPQRRQVLEAHDAQLDLQQARVSKCRSILARKLARYDALPEATT